MLEKHYVLGPDISYLLAGKISPNKHQKQNMGVKSYWTDSL